jgi:CubicO group peptidase (beta-lactamase class C family)
MSTPTPPTAKPEEVGLSPFRLGKLSEVLRAQVERGHIPGAVAIVSRNGKLAYHESFGVRDPNGREPMPKDAIFRVYSMSKAIVSVATMMLWEEGKLLLNEPVSKYIPAFAGEVLRLLENRVGCTVA